MQRLGMYSKASQHSKPADFKLFTLLINCCVVFNTDNFYSHLKLFVFNARIDHVCRTKYVDFSSKRNLPWR